MCATGMTYFLVQHTNWKVEEVKWKFEGKKTTTKWIKQCLDEAKHENFHSVGIDRFLFIFRYRRIFFLKYNKIKKGEKNMHEKLVLGAIKNTTKNMRQHLSPLSRISWLKHSSGINFPLSCNLEERLEIRFPSSRLSANGVSFFTANICL